MKFTNFTYRSLVVSLMLLMFSSLQAQQRNYQYNGRYNNNGTTQHAANSQTGPRSSFYDHILIIYVSGNGFNDISRIAFGTLFTDTFDSNYDALKLLSRAGQPSIYTLMDTTKMAINAIPNNTAQRDIVTGFIPGANGSFDVRFDSIHTFAPSTLIFWEDRTTHTIQNLRIDSTYTFTSNTADSANRFVLHFLPPVTTAITGTGCGASNGVVQVNLGLYNVAGTTVVWDSYVLKNASNQTVDSVAHANGTVSTHNLAAGNYTVQLSLNGYNVSIPVTVGSGGSSAIAAFSADSSTLHIGSAVNFNNTSTGGTTYSWNFGDNTTSTLQSPPAHTYATTGTFTVTLIVTNGACPDTTTHTVTVLAQPVVVASSAAAACGGTGSVIVNLDQNHVDTPPAVWNTYLVINSSNATIDSQTNVSGTVTTTNLQPGIYTVKVTRNGHTITLQDTVTQAGSITAAFTTDSTSYHVNGTVLFTSTSTGAGTYSWNFGDLSSPGTAITEQHSYANAGTYTVTLTIHNGTCVDTISHTVTVGANPIQSSTAVDAGCGGNGSITVNLDVNSVDSPPAVWSTYVVTNGSGTAVDTKNNVSGTVTSSLPAGTYTVTITRNGNNVVFHDTIGTVNNVTASFTVDSTTVHSGNVVTFTSTSTGAATYSWDFGDSGSATTSPATHVYNATGTYTVILTVTNNNCSDTATATVTVLPAILPGIAETAISNIRITSFGNTVILFTNGFVAENAVVTLFDVVGKQILTVKNVSLAGNRVDINANQNLSGYYFVRIIAGNQVFSGKVLLAY